MANFHYQAVDMQGNLTRGEMIAINESDLEQRLRKVGLDLVKAKESKPGLSLFNTQKITTQDLILFCYQLEQLMIAGVPLLDGLVDLRDSTTKPNLKTIVGNLVADVEGGKLMSEALAANPKVFNQVFVQLIKAGEHTGNLPEVLNHLGETLKWQSELVSQTKRLLMYPAFVVVVVIFTFTFLMLYLVPEMAKFLKSMGQTLPWQTRFMIWFSDIFSHYWWLFALGLVAVITGLVLLVKKNQNARYRWDYFKLTMPGLGGVFKKIILARFSRYFAMMYATGIPVLDAIRYSEGIVVNQVVANTLRRIYHQVSSGEAMKEAFQSSGLFPPLIVRMIGVGESTGTLDKSLMNVSYFYNREVNESVQKMLAMIEPMLTIFMGLLMAFIMFSVLGPVYDSFSKLKI